MSFYAMKAEDIRPGDVVTVWGQRGTEGIERTVTVLEIVDMTSSDSPVWVPGALTIRDVNCKTELFVLKDMVLGVDR